MAPATRLVVLARGALAAAALACWAPLACTSPGTAGLTDLDASPGAIRSWFDAHREHPRAILLLSPA